MRAAERRPPATTERARDRVSLPVQGRRRRLRRTQPEPFTFGNTGRVPPDARRAPPGLPHPPLPSRLTIRSQRWWSPKENHCGLTYFIIAWLYTQIYNPVHGNKNTPQSSNTRSPAADCVPIPLSGSRQRESMETMKTALVVEQDIAVQALVRLIVEQNGCALLEATSALKAFERFEGNARGSVRCD